MYSGGLQVFQRPQPGCTKITFIGQLQNILTDILYSVCLIYENLNLKTIVPLGYCRKFCPGKNIQLLKYTLSFKEWNFFSELKDTLYPNW